jgi:very-short-patch-repair endonuclease
MGPFINHNGRKIFYWLDFYLRNEKIDIECSPSMWHSIWGHDDKDKIRRTRLEQAGIIVLTLGDAELKNKHTLRNAIVNGLIECCSHTRKQTSDYVSLTNIEEAATDN